MLDPENQETKEVFAYYGLAMYQAQCLEKALALLLASQYGSKVVTRWMYDDRLAENMGSTLGLLASKFNEFARQKDIPWGNEIEARAKDRNRLAHDYFWERAAEFCSPEGRQRMLKELADYIERFEKADRKVTRVNRKFLEEHGFTEDYLKKVEEEIIATREEPPRLQRVKTSINIVSAYKWCPNPQSPSWCMLLLKDADGENLLLSDNGLCLGPSHIPENQLTPHSSFKEALPATVNPKPKGARSGNYKLTLANGYVLLVRTEDTQGRHVRRYTVRKQQV